jgi:DNA-binding SARP family transcriptional activator
VPRSPGKRDSSIISLSLLGGFSVERDGAVIPESVWERRSARSLVKLLALEPGHRLHREQIEETLWPNLATANNAFRKALHVARHALEPDLGPRGASAYLTVNHDLVALSPELVQIDIDQFRAAARDALERGEPEPLEAAIARYSGQLLPEDRYEEWTLGPRFSLDQLHLSLVLQLAGSLEQRGALAPAASRLREALLAAPANEDLHRSLMRLYALGGRRHQALRQYELCREALARELDAGPDAQTEALHDAILNGAIEDAVAPSDSHRVDRPAPLPAAIRWLPEGTLVARERERQQIAALLGEAASGHGSLVLIGGEAGVGKSRLVAEAAHAAHASGAIVLWGAAYEQEGQLPYGPFVEALSGVIHAGAGDPARWARTHPELARLLPGLDAALSPTGEAADPEAWRMRLYAAVGHLLEELSADRPLLLILDDIHIADTATLQLLHHLGRSAAERRWLVVGIYRAGEVAHGGELQRLGLGARWCRRIDLSCLARRDCDRLVSELLGPRKIDPDLLEEIYVQTLGNPLYVQELAHALREQGEIRRNQGTWMVKHRAVTVVPRHMREIVDSRIDALGGDARRALGLISVAGASCEFATIRDASDLDENCLVDALDQALEANLLDERGDSIVFRHPLVRSAVYEGLSGPRRQLLHAEIARAIERGAGSATGTRPDDIEALAYHWTAAAEPDRAIPWLVRAADQATRLYAHDEVLDRLTQALTLLDAAPGRASDRDSWRLTILERTGDLRALLGNSEIAREKYRSALGPDNPDDIAAVRIERKIANQSLVLGDLEEAEYRITLAESRVNGGLPGEDGALELARLQIVKAQTDFIAFRFAESLEAAELAIQLAESAGSEDDLAQGLEMAAMACLPLGHWQRGLDYERRRSGLSDVTRLIRDAADVHLCLADYHVYRSESAAVAQQLLETLQEAERTGAPRALALCHYYRGTMAYFKGKFPTALRRLTTAISLYDQVGSASGEAMCRLVRGVATTALGQLDEGLNDLELGLQAAKQGTMSGHAMIRLYAGLGRNRIDANDAEAARAYADAGLSLAHEPSTCICYASFHPVAAAAYALTGDLERASELGSIALAHARNFESPAFLCMAQQANAIVHAIAGTWEPAFTALDEAQELAEHHGLPYERCRTLLLRAFVHMRRGKPRDLATAARLTAEASPVLVRLGARAGFAQSRSSMGFLRDHLR